MVGQRAAPGVQDGQDADQPAHVVRIEGQLDEALGGGLHQQAVQDLLVASQQGAKLLRQGEDHVEVRYRQQFLPPGFQPGLGILPMTLGAGPIAAGVIGVVLPAAVVADVDLAAQGWGAAALEILHDAAVAGQQVPAEPVEILPAVAAEDVGDLGHGGATGRP